VSRRGKLRVAAYVLFFAALAGVWFGVLAWVERDARPPGGVDVVFKETPQDAVDKMLDMARVTKDDVVYDLGCGDARFLVTAAKKHGCRGVGYEIQPHVAALARQKVAEAGVGELVEIREGDIFDSSVDLRPATVLTLFLLPELNVKLIPKIQQMRPGCRVVSFLFDMEGVRPKEKIVYMMPNLKRECTLILWETPLDIPARPWWDVRGWW
jgi:SAM-dependent methyltransferase